MPCPWGGAGGGACGPQTDRQPQRIVVQDAGPARRRDLPWTGGGFESCPQRAAHRVRPADLGPHTTEGSADWPFLVEPAVARPSRRAHCWCAQQAGPFPGDTRHEKEIALCSLPDPRVAPRGRSLRPLDPVASLRGQLALSPGPGASSSCGCGVRGVRQQLRPPLLSWQTPLSP